MSKKHCLQILAATAVLVTASDAFAAMRGRHHHHVMRAAESPDAEVSRTRQYYPEEVENGVRGNLPFNNQMRKFSDPLNANGAGG